MKNGKPIDLAARLERLEADVKEIKALLQAQQQPQGWKAVVGAFADDPVFEEITRLGAEIREKERKKARRSRAKQKSAMDTLLESVDDLAVSAAKRMTTDEVRGARKKINDLVDRAVVRKPRRETA